MTYREPATLEGIDDEQANENAWPTIERAFGKSPLWPNGNLRRVTDLGPGGRGRATALPSLAILSQSGVPNPRHVVSSWPRTPRSRRAFLSPERLRTPALHAPQKKTGMFTANHWTLEQAAIRLSA